MNEFIRILFILITSFGITTIIVYGSIFTKLREDLTNTVPFLGKLINCVLCTSTWVVFFMSFLLGGISSTYNDLNIFLVTFLDGMFIAGGVWIINSIVEFFEEYR